MFLESVGADTAVYGEFESYSARGLVLARVAVSQNEHYQLLTDAGELSAEPSGALRHRTPSQTGMPVTGDWVAARVVGPEQAIVEAVLSRKTTFSRRAAGKREIIQILAANVDLAFLVCGLDGDFNIRRLERYLSLAAQGGVQSVVVLSKADLCSNLDARLAEAADVAGKAPVVAASSRTAGGLEGLRIFLRSGGTIVLLGSSGVGKSTIANFFLGQERLRTREVRESDSRGRHTTTRRELIPLPGGGALIDTPGLRELQLWAGEESVNRTFREITDIAAGCRFRDCSHSGESGCAVAEAVRQGVLGEDRLSSYRKLISEAKRHEEINDRLAAAARKRKHKAIHKAARAFFRQRDL